MLVIGTRGSPLALWQANHVQALLAVRGVETSIEIIKTSGDQLVHAPISSLGTKGLFTKEIEDALLAGRVHLAVHSLKDLGVNLPDGLCLAASPERENPHDALAGAKLASLPPGARVGTGSVRRAAQIRRLRPDLEILPIRGNVDTRVRKLDAGDYDAVVLAAAGLVRLGLGNRLTEEFRFSDLCPAPGQGALGIETALSGPGREAAALLNDPDTWNSITAERALLEALGGGCQLPVGAVAQVFAATLRLAAVVISPDGTELIRDELCGHVSDARQIGLDLGAKLRERGAQRILDEVYADSR